MNLKKLLFSVSAIVLSVSAAFGWGQKGHDVTAYIAEQHLTPTTTAAINDILNGRSIVYWANWLDNASHTQPYAYTKTWHYKNIDEGVRYEEAPANPSGDAVTAIRGQIESLTGVTKCPDPALALKILVHVVGDLHQPLHLGHATDLGGNRITIKYFGRDNKLHSIWDNALVDGAHKWSYTEWQQQLDRLSADEQAAVIAGTLDDWAKQTMAYAADIYKKYPEGTKLSYNDVAWAAPIIEEQLLRGGLRLAHILNMIFDPAYAATHTMPFPTAK